MPELAKSLRIPHAPDQVFELVSDIGRYPEFIKWIRSMRVTNQVRTGSVLQSRGEASVGFKGFSERFTTDVEADADRRTIAVKLVRGPFRRLKNHWQLRQGEDGGTVVDFYIDYEFRNPVLSLLARANTDLAVNRIMQAFLAEADRRYGNPA